jgi:hypothetical protein
MQHRICLAPFEAHFGQLIRKVANTRGEKPLLLLENIHLQRQLPELLLRLLPGGVHHQVLGGLVHGEGDGLADVLLAGEEHDDAVEAGGDAAVGGRVELEGVDHAAELG